VEMRPEHPYDPYAVLRFTEITFARRERRGRMRLWWARKRNERAHRWQATFNVVTSDGVTRYVFPSAAPSELPWRFAPAVWSPDLQLDWPEDEADALVRDRHRTTAIRPTHVRIPALLGGCRVDVWPPGACGTAI